jgi:hypothetical protein
MTHHTPLEDDDNVRLRPTDEREPFTFTYEDAEGNRTLIEPEDAAQRDLMDAVAEIMQGLGITGVTFADDEE